MLYILKRDDTQERRAKIFQFSKRVLPEISKRVYDIEQSTGKKITDPNELNKIVKEIIIKPLVFQKTKKRSFMQWWREEPKPTEFVDRFDLSEKTTSALAKAGLVDGRKIYNMALKNNEKVKEIRVNEPTGILVRNLVKIYEMMKKAKKNGDIREYHHLMKLFRSLNNRNYEITEREEEE